MSSIQATIWAGPSEGDDGFSATEEWFWTLEVTGMIGGSVRLEGRHLTKAILDEPVELSCEEIERRGLFFMDDGAWATIRNGKYTDIRN